MLVLLSLILTALIGMAGLAVDIGFVTLERRVLQNAVDAAAASGAIDLVESIANINTDVQAMATRNGVAPGAILACQFVDNSNVVTKTDCTSPVPSTTSGVHVSATTTRDTFFMRALGIETVTVAAESTARVSGWGSYPAAASLFIVCGYDTYLYPSGTKSILQGTAPGSSPWNVDPTAIGLTYTIHASHVADCGLDSAGGGGEGGGGGKKEKDSKKGTETEGLERFKGLRDRDDTGYKAVPTTLLGDNGKKTGPTAQAVEAIDGCGVGEDPHNCVMIIPIAVSAVKSGSDNIFTIVRWLPFQVTSYKNGSVKHTGRLLGTDWVVRHQPTTNLVPWTVGSAIGPTSVRLVE